MSRHEAPPVRLVVEGQHLVPAAAWDAERLATYRPGTIVSARITQEKNRKLERKYWAILHRVVETCNVKQKSAEELHRAIRFELDMVEGFCTIEGRLRIDLKSTVGLQEPEYRAFFEEAMALLHDKLGVDPETLGAEAADVGDDEDQEPAAAQSSPAADEAAAGSGEASPCAAAADPSPLKAQLIGSLKLECINKALMTARDDTISQEDRDKILEQARGWWTGKIPTEATFVGTVFDHALDVSNGKPAPTALRYLRALAAGKDG